MVRIIPVALAALFITLAAGCAVDDRQLHTGPDDAVDGSATPTRDGSLSTPGADGSRRLPDGSLDEQTAAIDASLRPDAAGGSGLGDGGATPCAAGTKRCGADCVAVDDPTYGCGLTSCDKTACPAPGDGTLVCQGTACVVGACPDGQKKCGSVCVAVDNAAYGCGLTSCVACAPVPGTTQVCQAGACVVSTCAAGTKKCGDKCVAIDDVTYGCGATTCDKSSCPAGQLGTLVCQAGACVVGTCAAGTKKCAGKCVSLTDPTYGCGATSCDATLCPTPPAGASLICSGTSCVLGTCPAGTKKCGTNCVPTDRNNGCADPAVCTVCAASESCVGTPAKCACVPNDDACTATGKNCGSVVNNCGTMVSCGTCMAPQTCMGGGVANKCGCTPLNPCTGGKCGTGLSDGCSGKVDCTCTGTNTCGGGGTPGLCGCTPKTCAGACGNIADGCGKTLACTPCCVPTVCAAGQCGVIANVCGGTINCGACTGAGQVCGGRGVANVCAVPLPVLAAQGQACASNAACANGRCVDGVCCAAASCGTCMRCNLNGQGTCSSVAAGTADPACPTNPASCMAGGCSGSGATCRAAAVGTACGTSCVNGAEPPGGGQFSQPRSQTKSCNGSAAGAAACVASSSAAVTCSGGATCADATRCRVPASCTTAAECADGYYCNGGTCALRKLDLADCTEPYECNSRVCTGSRSNPALHCSPCLNSYTCPSTLPDCPVSAGFNECRACGETDFCNSLAAPHTNGTASCSRVGCPANATDCGANDECHCGSLDRCQPGQVCVSSQCKVAPLWPCVSNDCAYGTCANGQCPQAPSRAYCTGLPYPVSECASGNCGDAFIAPPGSTSIGTSACP